ncbi:protein SRG1 [Citrus sinensis]|uniref:Protein SRG1 n=1 Tax=Citrus sinensis TaxID=2711 RepID=A0ACB8JTR6_CITSI|nr:protein SRG1 [Citrus sinensis]
MASNSDETITKNIDAPTYVPSLPLRVDPLLVPERYIRNQEDRSQLNDMSDLSSEVPITDLSRLTMGDLEELDKLDLASKEWGLLSEQKNKHAVPSDDIQGYGHAYVVSEQQILDSSDALILFVCPAEYRKLNFWPNTPKGLREIIDANSKEMKNVGKGALTLNFYNHGDGQSTAAYKLCV